MILIKDIQSYRDGGTIGIWTIYRIPDFGYTSVITDEPTITIDYSMPNGTGEWYLGWKNKGGKLIEDNIFKAKVLKAIHDKIDQEVKYADKILTTITTV